MFKDFVRSAQQLGEDIPEFYRFGFGSITLIILVVSLYLPFDHKLLGYEYLFMGWVGPFFGSFGWYAIPFMLWNVGRLIYGKRVAIVPAIIGLAVSTQGMLTTDFSFETSYTAHWRIGFYIWYGCACLMLPVAVFDHWKV